MTVYITIFEEKSMNDPELSGKYLGSITSDFAMVSETLKEASYAIRKRGFSDYPIFPIAKVQLPIGQLLIGKDDIAINWYINASFLDEFVQREIIAEDAMDDFIASFKDPDEYCCLFVVDEDFTRFVYIPYPED